MFLKSKKYLITIITKVYYKSRIIVINNSFQTKYTNRSKLNFKEDGVDVDHLVGIKLGCIHHNTSGVLACGGRGWQYVEQMDVVVSNTMSTCLQHLQVLPISC